MRTSKYINLILASVTTMIFMASSQLNAQSTVISTSGTVNKLDETVYTVYIPNSFTPNSDGINDKFMVFSDQLKRISIKIYDQMGQEVFSTIEMGQGWDGKHHNREMHQDTYLYRIEAEFVNGYSEVLVGPLSLIR